MAAGDLKLLGAWSSPFAIRSRVAFYLKNINYEYVEENLFSKSEILLKSNPIFKKVPVLIHNNNPICESLVILQYIDEVFTSGSSLLPADPYDRAIARFWAAYIDDKLFKSLSQSMRGKTEEEKATAVEGVSTGLALLEEAFEKISKGKAFFGGETIGYLDIVFGSLLGWIRVAEKFSGSIYIDEIKMPCIFGWAERFVADAAVKEFLPETNKLMEFAKILFAMYANPAK